MADAKPPRDILSEFWSPVCAIGGHGAAGPNAQICVSVFGASVTPDKPRLLIDLWKDNFTHELVAASGTLAVTILSEDDAPLVETLGMRSGRDGDKLAGTGFALTASDDPFFPSGAGAVECDIIHAFDLGDATSFLVAVRSRERFAGRAPLTRDRMHALLGPEFSQRWSAIAAARAPKYGEQMLWR